MQLIKKRYLGEDVTKTPVPKWSNSTRNFSSYHSRGVSLHDDDSDDVDENGFSSYTRYFPSELNTESA